MTRIGTFCVEPETFNSIGMGTGLWVFESEGVVDSQMLIIAYVPNSKVHSPQVVETLLTILYQQQLAHRTSNKSPSNSKDIPYDKTSTIQDLSRKLREIFHLNTFRRNQLEAINASLCYFLLLFVYKSIFFS